jgi:hypothetical protein
MEVTVKLTLAAELQENLESDLIHVFVRASMMRHVTPRDETLRVRLGRG